jgi:5-methylthioadenosine/S-adenosylhomocysteine deaminase
LDRRRLPNSLTSIAIRDTTIVTQDDKRRTLQGDVYIEDDKIVSVGGRAPEADRTLDGSGQVVMPGLVNLHTHVPMGLFRGYGDDMLLESWLQDRIWPAEAKLDATSMRAGADLGHLEMLMGGTTSYLDMYWMEAEVIADSCRQAGLRGWCGEGMLDIGQTDEGDANKKLPGIEASIKATKNDSLITHCPSPHGTYTVWKETYIEAARIATEYEVPLHTHCSETRTEVHDVEAKYGQRPIAVLKETGALDANAVLAHCGWITKQEAKDIGDAKAAVATCPVSNMKLATGGVCPVPELHECAACVGIGTDGPASNNGTDMFESMKFTALAQKQHRWDATVLPAQRVLDMGTRDGADALRRPDLGRLVPGATADLIMIDFNRPQLVPRHDVVSHLVYATSSRDVSATIVAGQVLMQDRAPTTLDVSAVLAAAEQAATAVTGE